MFHQHTAAGVLRLLAVLALGFAAAAFLGAAAFFGAPTFLVAAVFFAAAAFFGTALVAFYNLDELVIDRVPESVNSAYLGGSRLCSRLWYRDDSSRFGRALLLCKFHWTRGTYKISERC